MNRFGSVERVFAVLMVFTACSMAFAHGSNDVANAVGPLAAIAGTVQSGGEIAAKSAMPWWILLVGAMGIVVGLATYGWRVITTVGRKITELTPSRGFAAELGAAGTVVIASATGLPISTTHTLVGAVLGVGFARGIGALNLRTSAPSSCPGSSPCPPAPAWQYCSSSCSRVFSTPESAPPLGAGTPLSRLG